MANVFTGNPLLIDTVMTTVYPSNPSNIYIRDLTWDLQANAGDQLTIVDGNGRIILDTKASAPNVNERFGHIGWVFGGFKVTVLGSGKVMVFIR